jgi:hypothetical protein
MTRTRWTGLAGVLFGIVLFVGGALAGSTPDSSGSGAPDRYLKYWTNSDHQDKAWIATLILSYISVLLVAFAAGLRDRLRAVDAGPLPSFVLASGAVSAALLVAGAMASLTVGATASEAESLKVDGSIALMFDHLGYGILAPGLMAGAAMAVAVGIVTLRTRVLPVWTAYLGFLIGLGGLGSYFSAWTGFFVLPLWSVVIGIVLLMRSEAAEAVPAA